MATKPTLTVLQKCHVSPPPGTVDNRSLPLTFFDILWLSEAPVHHLFFYEFPHSNTHFMETVIPNLKHSLSVTLQHFFPFSGNLTIFPNPTEKPEIRYTDGDSIVITFAESILDFKDLVGNHPRDCDQFYPLIPPLGHATKLSDYVSIPVFSVQVTVFPNLGFSIGTTNHHCLGDGSTTFNFMKAWASIARSGTDESFLAHGDLPIYDRVIKNQNLDEFFLSKQKLETFNEEYQPQHLVGPTDNVRATFVLTRSVINRLKQHVSTQLPTLEYVSSFIVACAYIWSCVAKSRNDELEVFGFAVDCRGRMDPRVPTAYFGNCVTGLITVAKTACLTDDEGFLTAAKLLGKGLNEVVKNKDGILANMKGLADLRFEKVPTTMMGVAGTPKHKFYDTDFGWGRPKKYETISIDYSGSISMNACKDSVEDLEIGLCLSRNEMKAFVGIFNGGLKECGA